MPKLERVSIKPFAGDVPLDECGVFGSAANGSKINTTDITQIQSLDAYIRGWGGAVVSDQDYPPLEEMNAVQKVSSYGLNYLYQMGIPEYDIGTTYYINSFVQSDGKLYKSVTDDNLNNPVTDTSNWEEFSAGSGSSIPLCSIQSGFYSDTFNPDGWFPCNGTEFPSGTFQTIWDTYLLPDTNGNTRALTCTYEEYANMITNNGYCPMFAVDTVNSKFKIPFIKDGISITQAQSPGEAGKIYGSKLPDIQGPGGRVRQGSGDTWLGAFKDTTTETIASTSFGTSAGTWARLDYKASNSNAIYDPNVNEVIAPQARLRHFVVMANANEPASQTDWNNFVNALNGKANLDLANTLSNIDYVVESNVNGTEWFKKFRSGFKITGGRFTSTGGNQDISLNLEFTNTDYTVLANCSTTFTGQPGSVSATSLTNSAFRARGRFASSEQGGNVYTGSVMWVAYGY